MADVREPAIETHSGTPTASGVRCVFCRIAAKDEQADIVYEDESYVCFRDRRPCATHHYLLIPRLHIRSESLETSRYVSCPKPEVNL